MHLPNWLQSNPEQAEAEQLEVDPEFAERDGLGEELNKRTCAHWQKRLLAEDEAHRVYRREAKKAEEHYHNEKESQRENDEHPNFYPSFYNAVQIQHAALYGGNPAPDVRRRFPDASAADQGKQDDEHLATAIQRGLSYSLDTSTAYTDLSEAVEDFSVVSLGVTRVTREKIDGVTRIGLERWPWSKYRWEPCSQWRDCDWIGFDHYMTPKEITKQFSVEPMGANAVACDGAGTSGTVDSGVAQLSSDLKHEKDKIRVTEILHKPTKKIIVVADGYSTLLDFYSDPWGIDGFYTSAKPMMLGCKSGEFIPKPEMLQFRHLIRQIDRLTQRIRKIERASKDVTFYDKSLGDVMARLGPASDGDYIPLDSIMEKFVAQGGTNIDMNNAMVRLPIAERVQLMEYFSQERGRLVVALNESMGIADIMAGMSNPNEAAETQHLKSDWGSARMRKKRQIVNEHIRATLRIMGDMVASMDPQELQAISGVPLSEELQAKLQSDVMRTYAIDIESDSTGIQDRYRDQASRAQATDAIINIAGTMGPQVQAGTVSAQVYQETLNFLVRGFPAARSLEDAVGTVGQNMDMVAQLQQQIQQMADQDAQNQQTIGDMQNALGAAQAVIAERTEAEAARDMAGVGKDFAEAEKKRAEADKIRSDTVIQNSQQLVPPMSSADELAEGLALQAGWDVSRQS